MKPEDVKDIDFILGGDHGKEAFRLCFRVVLTPVKGDMIYRDYGGAGTALGKDTSDVLKQSILPWLSKDLQAINDSKMLIDVAEDGKTDAEIEGASADSCQVCGAFIAC